MRSDPALAALQDIAHHIELATGFVAGMSFETFRDDLRTFYAVTRCLEIISEASRRLPDDLNARHPSIAWREMAGAGNVYLTITKTWLPLSYGPRYKITCRPCAPSSGTS